MRIRLAVLVVAVSIASGCGGGGGGGSADAPDTRRVLVLPHVLDSHGRITRVATGDVNGDGVSDLLAFNEATSSVEVLLSTALRESPSLPSRGTKGRLARGADAFASAPAGTRHVLVWDSLADLCLADMDGDGALDLVAAGGAAAQVGVWRGDPLDRDEFRSPILLDTTVRADRVAVGDVNGDGALDLVTLDEATGQPKIFLASSVTPPFAVGNDPPAVGACHGLVLADMDRDGDLDFVTNRFGSDVVTIFEAGAAGHVPRDVATGQSTGRAMGVGDVDGDGWVDIVVASEDGRTLVCLHQHPAKAGFFDIEPSPLDIAIDEEGVQVAQNDKSTPQLHLRESPTRNHLRESPTRASSGATRLPITQPGMGLCDLDRDGHMDVVISPAIGDPDFDLLIVFGLRESPTRYHPTPQRARSIEKGSGAGGSGRACACLADFDADGHTDLAIGDPDFDLLRVHYLADLVAPPPLSFQELLRESPSKQSTGLLARDMDRDGLLDLVTSTTGGLEIRFQDASAPGTYLQPLTLAAAQSFVTVVVGDVNNDGCPDLITGIPGSLVTILRDPAVARGFLPPILFPPPIPGGDFRSLALADLDRDGNLDCVAIRESPSKASLGRGMGNGFFDVFTEIDVPVSSPTDVACCDLNGDGLLDLVVCGDKSDGSAVVFLDGLMPPKTMTAEPLRLQGGVRVACGDLDGDGRLDVVTTGDEGCVVALQDPDTRGRFLPSYALSSLACGGLSLVDLDRDGLLDVCFVETKTGTLACMPGDPDFDLLRIVSLNGLPPGVPVRAVHLETMDSDNDGICELVTLAPPTLGAPYSVLRAFGLLP